MKKLVILALALITFQANAQDNKKEKRQDMKKARLEKRIELEPQEMATIQTKKMTLHLDLTEAQQKKVMALNLKNATKRKEGMKKRHEAKEKTEKVKPTKEEKLKRVNAKLDAQIESKQQMKAILDAEQYAKWEKSSQKRGQRKAGMKKKGQRMKAHKKEEQKD